MQNACMIGNMEKAPNPQGFAEAHKKALETLAEAKEYKELRLRRYLEELRLRNIVSYVTSLNDDLSYRTEEGKLKILDTFKEFIAAKIEFARDIQKLEEALIGGGTSDFDKILNKIKGKEEIARGKLEEAHKEYILKQLQFFMVLELDTFFCIIGRPDQTCSERDAKTIIDLAIKSGEKYSVVLQGLNIKLHQRGLYYHDDILTCEPRQLKPDENLPVVGKINQLLETLWIEGWKGIAVKEVEANWKSRAQAKEEARAHSLQ